MNSIVARAPGKLFLLGEYAVLDGCPGVVAAVDRYAQAVVRRNGCGAICRISSSGYGQLEFPARQPPQARGPLRFVLAAYAAALRSYPCLGGSGLTIEIASNLDAQTGAKVGLGGSAAITVATVAAVLAMAADTPLPINRDVILTTALAAHHHAQDGIGSGADIAASVFGGIIRFDRHNGSLPRVTRLAFPTDLQLLVGWTGEAASTTDLVRRYLGLADDPGAPRIAFVDATRLAVEAFETALALGGQPFSALRCNGLAVEGLETRAALPIVTTRLRDLIRIAEAHGAAAKISGAGGGDCGIALTNDRAAADRIREEWHAAGILPLDLAMSSKGVCVGHR